MAEKVLLLGPVPESPLGWCAVCAGQYKNDQVEGDLKEDMAAAQARSKRTTVRLPYPATAHVLAPAVAYGMYPVNMPPMGMIILQVPLCWTHLMPMEAGPGSGLTQATAADAAALDAASRPRGPGGAAMLGG